MKEVKVAPNRFNKHYEPNLFDEFLICDGTRKSDITFLFRQESLEANIGAENLERYFERVFKESPNPFENFSDDELFDVVKLRGLQNFNDVYNYGKFIMSNKETADAELQEFNQYRKDKANEQELHKQRVEFIKSLFNKD